MSFRGSFVTSCVYCQRCFEALKKVLVIDNGADLSRVFIGRFGEEVGIISGFVKGLYYGEEVHCMEDICDDLLKEDLCHEVHIALLGESSDEIISIKGKEKSILTVNIREML